MLFLKLMNLFYLDNYKTLLAKYKDPYREIFQSQRQWAYDNYKEYFKRALKEQGLQTAFIMRQLKRSGNYIRLYNIMLDVDGDIENQIPLTDKEGLLL